MEKAADIDLRRGGGGGGSKSTPCWSLARCYAATSRLLRKERQCLRAWHQTPSPTTCIEITWAAGACPPGVVLLMDLQSGYIFFFAFSCPHFYPSASCSSFRTQLQHLFLIKALFIEHLLYAPYHIMVSTMYTWSDVVHTLTP